MLSQETIARLRAMLNYYAENHEYGDGNPCEAIACKKQRIVFNLETTPSRVYVHHMSSNIQACSLAQARSDFGVEPKFILVRKDGWTLGCDASTLAAATALWEDEWIALIALKQLTELHQESKSEVLLSFEDVSVVTL